jgi:hypothetical protein
VSNDLAVLPVGGDGVRTFTWLIAGGNVVDLDLEGPADAPAVLTGTASTLLGDAPVSIPLT